MDRTVEEVDANDCVEGDVQVAETATRITGDEPSAEERLRDAYRLW